MNTFEQIIQQLKGDASLPQRTGGVYFLGIGGIGMSALARYFKQLGIQVSGYDKTPTPLTDLLVQEGIAIHFTDDVDLADTDAQLVVYTPAIPPQHSELNYFLNERYLIKKRSDVLGAITSASYSICIAGTHGKTTTSSMVAHLLTHSGYGCNAFLGGIAVNYNSNFWSHERNVCVAEADEYDRSFLKLNPDMAIISSMDPDHLDIYGTAENMEQAFIDFSSRIRNGGTLLYKHGLKRADDLQALNRLSYHLSDAAADVNATDIRISQGRYIFDVNIKDALIRNVVLNMGGLHNIENALVAIAVAYRLGISEEKIVAAVAAFKGVKRRFEYIIPPQPGSHDMVFIDDYAHHPEELRALITGVKTLFSNRKMVVAFQPHLYSRTNDLADEFAEVLDMADEVILLPIYPARELPMPGVSSQMIADRMEIPSKAVMEKEALLLHLQQEINAHVEEGYAGTVFITAGAGDIDALVPALKNIIQPNEESKTA